MQANSPWAEESSRNIFANRDYLSKQATYLLTYQKNFNMFSALAGTFCMNISQ